MALRILGARDGVELLKPALGDSKRRKDRTDRCRRGRFRSNGRGVRIKLLEEAHSWPPFLLSMIRNVTESYTVRHAFLYNDT